jgi:hypothetical protein
MKKATVRMNEIKPASESPVNLISSTDKISTVAQMMRDRAAAHPDSFCSLLMFMLISLLTMMFLIKINDARMVCQA